jgi:hypothetical protein
MNGREFGSQRGSTFGNGDLQGLVRPGFRLELVDIASNDAGRSAREWTVRLVLGFFSLATLHRPVEEGMIDRLEGILWILLRRVVSEQCFGKFAPR